MKKPVRGVTTRQNDPMSTWNYRVVQSADGAEYFIAEVYYDGVNGQAEVPAGGQIKVPTPCGDF